MERKLTRPLEGAQGMSDNHDAFAFGGDQSDSGDARVLALFHDWLDACRATDRHVNDDDQTEYDAALKRMVEIEKQIAATLGGPKAAC